VTLIEQFMEEADDPYEKFGDVQPIELVHNIMDWVNPGDESFNGGSKDSEYLRYDPPYKAKRHRFFTLDELRLVRGMNDAIYKKLKPYITVNSYDGKINLNSIRERMLKALYDFTDEDVKKIMEEKNLRQGWASVDDFVNYVSDDLNFSDFKERYDDKDNYPFTVSSFSFFVESLGQVKKSGSQIQKVIQVGVALKAEGTSKFVKGVDDIATQKECETDNSRFWDPRDKKCKAIPANEEQCTNLPGQWIVEEGGKKGCQSTALKKTFYIDEKNPPKSGTTDPNTMKVLYWLES